MSLSEKTENNLPLSIAGMRDVVQRGADWLVNTQNRDKDSADHGRFLYAVDLETGESWRSTGWQTAFGVFALLSAENLFGERKYREAATHAIRYLKTLQITDNRVPALHGAIREEVPQTDWSHPRDAMSVAWCLLAWYWRNKDTDALQRAVLYADWMLKYAFFDDWIVATVNLGGDDVEANDIFGSFQSGTILFLIELYRTTQDLRYYDAAFRMAGKYVNEFIDEQGRITVIRDRIGNRVNDWNPDWQKMHQVNDDFGGISLVNAWRLFKKPACAQRCGAYFRWLEERVNPDGSFFDPVVEVGSATSAIFLLSYRDIAPGPDRPAVDRLIGKCLGYLASIQKRGENGRTDGAFPGMDNHCNVGHGKFVNIRCSTYAVLAFCAALGQSAFPVFPFRESGGPTGSAG